MRGPERPALVIALYLLVVTQGPKVMSPFKPLKLTRILVVYNFAMVALATYIFVLVSALCAAYIFVLMGLCVSPTSLCW